VYVFKEYKIGVDKKYCNQFSYSLKLEQIDIYKHICYAILKTREKQKAKHGHSDNSPRNVINMALDCSTPRLACIRYREHLENTKSMKEPFNGKRERKTSVKHNILFVDSLKEVILKHTVTGSELQPFSATLFKALTSPLT
jgi:tRNA A22 N-methylase